MGGRGSSSGVSDKGKNMEQNIVLYTKAVTLNFL